MKILKHIRAPAHHEHAGKSGKIERKKMLKNKRKEC